MRPLGPPRLYLRKPKGNGSSRWVILDDGKEIGTGVEASDTEAATDALLKYLRSKNLPTDNPKVVYSGQKLRGKGNVYVVGFSTYVKIGYSKYEEISHRLKQLQIACPEELIVYAVLPGTRETERMLHWRFWKLRLRGEWFRAEGELADWIASVSPSTEPGFLGVPKKPTR